MAKLANLKISGIRSFGPCNEHVQQLEFATPLTLILGPNGCGKTSIIESIKFACTGSLPDGTINGQGFVHHPKMSSSSSTQGEIELELLDAKNNTVVISRVVELTKLNKTFKRSYLNAGTSFVFGHDQVNKKCLQLMNVSKTILDNVIFCHQENSAWPLSENKKLKEKFDKIFEAEEYRNFGDEMKHLIKLKKGQIKILRPDLEYKRSKRKQVEKQERDLQNKEYSLVSLENTITGANEKLEPIKQRIDEIIRLENELMDLKNQLITKQVTKDALIEEQDTIRKCLFVEFKGDNQELEDKIKSFEKDRDEDTKKITKLQELKNQLEIKNNNNAKLHHEAKIQFGKLSQEKCQYEKNCNQRASLINVAKTIMAVEITDAAVALAQLKSKLEQIETKLEKEKKEKEMGEDRLQLTINDAIVKVTRTEQDISFKQEELFEITEKLNGIKEKLQLMRDVDEPYRFQEAEETQKLETLQKEINNMQRCLKTLEDEHKILLQNDGVQEKLEFEIFFISEKEREVNKIMEKHIDALKQLFGENIPETNFKDSMLKLQNKADNLTIIISSQINKKQKEVTTLEAQRQHRIETLESCKEEIKMKQEQLSQVCDGQDYSEILQSTYQKKEKLQADKNQYSSTKILYEQFIKKFEELSPCCPVCETSFTGKVDIVTSIVTNLRAKVDQVPQELARIEYELEKEEAFYSKLQQLNFTNYKIFSLCREKLQLEQQLEDINGQLARGNVELEKLTIDLVKAQKTTKIAKAVITDVALLDQSQFDIDKSREKIESLKTKLVKVASNKSKLELESELANLKSNIEAQRLAVDVQRKNLQRHKDLVHKFALEDEQKKLKTEIDTLQTKLTSMKNELKNANENKEYIVGKNKLELKNEYGKISNYLKLIQKIEEIQNNIDDYLAENTNEKLESIENELMEYSNEETDLNERMINVTEAISTTKEALALQESNFRILQDNISLRKKKIFENQLEDEIKELNAQLEGYDNIYKEKCQLLKDREILEKDINIAVGEKNVLNIAIEELRQELEKPENKNARAQYLSKFYEFNVTEQLINDLTNYTVALDRAIIDFHQTKLTQLNKNIRELWRDIYRGNDIDYIEIKTESSRDKTLGYDYKVIQVKNGISYYMKGHSSAGQKVLACLIIRMALAEILGCRILSLDEPTANLDRENKLSFSDTLSRIVNRRQDDSFQLLIITHDVEFLNALTKTQGVSHYYRVERDHESLSIIKKEYSLP